MTHLNDWNARADFKVACDVFAQLQVRHGLPGLPGAAGRQAKG
jgi:hypothetical protein